MLLIVSSRCAAPHARILDGCKHMFPPVMIFTGGLLANICVEFALWDLAFQGLDG